MAQVQPFNILEVHSVCVRGPGGEALAFVTITEHQTSRESWSHLTLQDGPAGPHNRRVIWTSEGFRMHTTVANSFGDTSIPLDPRAQALLAAVDEAAGVVEGDQLHAYTDPGFLDALTRAAEAHGLTITPG